VEGALGWLATTTNHPIGDRSGKARGLDGRRVAGERPGSAAPVSPGKDPAASERGRPSPGIRMCAAHVTAHAAAFTGRPPAPGAVAAARVAFLAAHRTHRLSGATETATPPDAPRLSGRIRAGLPVPGDASVALARHMEAIDGGVTGSAGETESACTRGGVRCSRGSWDGQVSLFSGSWRICFVVP